MYLISVYQYHFRMKRFYFWGISGITFLFLFGWMLNCSGVSSSPTSQLIPNFSTKQVISSDWIDANQWVTTIVLGMPARSCELYNKQLTTNILDNHKLYVYSQIDNSIHSVPFTLNNNNSELRYDYTLPKSSILKIVAIGMKGEFSPVGAQKYRYVLINNDLAKNISINMDDYEAVKAAFNLED